MRDADDARIATGATGKLTSDSGRSSALTVFTLEQFAKAFLAGRLGHLTPLPVPGLLDAPPFRFESGHPMLDNKDYEESAKVNRCRALRDRYTS